MTRESIKVDLVVPGIFDLPLHELDAEFLQNELSGLHHLLSYGNSSDNNYFDLDQILCRQLGLQNLDYLPFAQAYTDNHTSTGELSVLVKPMHLKADINNAVFYPLTEQQTDFNDAALIINDLGEFFKDNCSFELVEENLWLMQLTSISPPENTPHYLSALGKKAKPFIEQSKQGLDWYRLMNEIQMFMFQHEVNQNRISQSLPIINSLWCWGAGRLPDQATQKRDWYCDDPIFHKLANCLNGQSRPIDELTDQPLSRDTLLIDLSILKSLKIYDGTALSEVLLRFENRIIKPLLKKTEVIQLQLYSAADFNLLYCRSDRFKFWRKRKTLANFNAANDIGQIAK